MANIENERYGPQVEKSHPPPQGGLPYGIWGGQKFAIMSQISKAKPVTNMFYIIGTLLSDERMIQLEEAKELAHTVLGSQLPSFHPHKSSSQFSSLDEASKRLDRLI